MSITLEEIQYLYQNSFFFVCVILGSEESLLNFYLYCSYHQGYLSLLHKKRKHIK